MTQLRTFFAVGLVTLFSLASMSVCAMTTYTPNSDGSNETSTVIVTEVPAPKEVVVPPQGYTTCTTVSAGWYEGVWHPEYKTCRYNPEANPSFGGEAWIAGHWVCNQYKVVNGSGECTNWDWREGHWEQRYLGP